MQMVPVENAILIEYTEKRQLEIYLISLIMCKHEYTGTQQHC